ncbi:hypothetical protein [Pontibacter anaerobius]|uniref:Uncharacterized protein n=1 Tax=Pontibacter anaerobius TaxID=2993940 RepID=A0ABT3RAV4_9BACT|nr:hypothetical protein [Pontibacter anaerobius]MCX2738646.1 hypothetical protein [Pontibacter anaerobius]
MFVLRLRHWQTFLLLFTLPFLLQHGLLWLLDALQVRPGRFGTMLLDALPATVYVLWLWLVGSWLFRRLPQSIKITPLYFHLGNLYIILYTLVFVYTLALARDNMATATLPFGMLALLVPMHLFATFCYLYAVYFVARSLVSVEKQLLVQTGEYLKTFIFFLLLPLGIWFLQPRLRKLYLSES